MSDNGGLWAVVQTAAGTYIGKLTGEKREGREQMKEALLYTSKEIPVPGPQGVAVHHMNILRSFGPVLNPLSAWVTPINVIYFNDLEPADREAMQTFIKEGQRGLQEARASRAGIATPNVQGNIIRS